MEAGGDGELLPWLVAAFSMPCALILFSLGQAGLRAAAAALRGDGHAWPSRSAFLGYFVARPGGGSAFHGSVFCHDDEPLLPPECCDSLAVAVYRRGREASGPDPECVFCLSVVGDGDEVRELRCGHVFHRPCLDAWLVRPRATCPLCRDRLLPAEVAGCYGFDDGRLSSSAHAHAHTGSIWT